MHQVISPSTLTLILLSNALVKYVLVFHFRAPTTTKTMSLRCLLLQTNFHIRKKPNSPSEAHFTVKFNLNLFHLSKLFLPLLGAYGFETRTHIFLSQAVWT